jgi:hypothetical protein
MKSPFGNVKFPFGEDKEAKKAAEEAAAKAAAEEARLAAAPKLPSMDELLSKVPAINVDISDFDIDSVVENLTPSDGKSLGERGEVFFAGQVVLILCILIGTVPVV